MSSYNVYELFIPGTFYSLANANQISGRHCIKIVKVISSCIEVSHSIIIVFSRLLDHTSIVVLYDGGLYLAGIVELTPTCCVAW